MHLYMYSICHCTEVCPKVSMSTYFSFEAPTGESSESTSQQAGNLIRLIWLVWLILSYCGANGHPRSSRGVLPSSPWTVVQPLHDALLCNVPATFSKLQEWHDKWQGLVWESCWESGCPCSRRSEMHFDLGLMDMVWEPEEGALGFTFRCESE